MAFFLIALASIAVVLGVMIVAHEFGHFAVAKLLGVRVDVFSIGFGKRLWGFRRGDTDYRIAALPLGGYVKMAGENPMEERRGDPREFLSKPRWQRFLVALAGPAMNFVLAIALLTGAYMVHFETAAYLDSPAVIGWVEANSPAAKAGLRAGDRIVRFDGMQNPTWEDVDMKTVINPGQAVAVAVERAGQAVSGSVVPETVGPDRLGGEVGWAPTRSIYVSTVDADLPAGKAGLRPGDQIVSLNGTGMCCIEQLLAFLTENKNQPVRVQILRAGQPLEFTATPVLSPVDGSSRYRLGFSWKEAMTVEKLPFASALGQSVSDNVRLSLLIVEFVQKLVERKASVKQLSSPIGIAKASGEAALQPGWIPLIELTAAISVNLGIVNLLPIPILDGGMILMLLIEGTLRHDISMRIKERIYQAAFVFLILLVGLTIYNDLLKTVPGLSKYLP